MSHNTFKSINNVANCFVIVEGININMYTFIYYTQGKDLLFFMLNVEFKNNFSNDLHVL